MPLSTKQMEYLALAWQCFESEPKIDYDKFKDVAGLASAHSARELMRVTKNKLKSEYGALSGEIKTANAATPKKSATPSSKSATPSSKVTKSGSATPKTPATGKRGRPGGKKSRAEVEEANGAGEAESSAGSEIDVETPTAKKVKVNGMETPTPKKAKVNGVKAEANDDIDFGNEDMFQ